MPPSYLVTSVVGILPIIWPLCDSKSEVFSPGLDSRTWERQQVAMPLSHIRAGPFVWIIPFTARARSARFAQVAQRPMDFSSVRQRSCSGPFASSHSRHL